MAKQAGVLPVVFGLVGAITLFIGVAMLVVNLPSASVTGVELLVLGTFAIAAAVGLYNAR
jgi:hypothetical protein